MSRVRDDCLYIKNDVMKNTLDKVPRDMYFQITEELMEEFWHGLHIRI